MTNFNESIFKRHEEQLKNISYDDSNKVYLSVSAKVAVNFDKVKTDYLNSMGFSNEMLKSCDALYTYNMGHCLIEFKNCAIARNDIRIKIADSLLILSDIKNLNIVDITKKEFEFVLVYNEQKNKSKVTAPQKEMHSHLSSLSQTEYIYFDLERYKGVYFKDVHTYTEIEFDRYINNL